MWKQLLCFRFFLHSGSLFSFGKGLLGCGGKDSLRLGAVLGRHGGFHDLFGLAHYHFSASGREFFLKFLHAACSVKQFLFAGIKRMAGGADFNLDGRFNGAGFKSVAAYANYFAKIIVRMDTDFHKLFSLKIRSFCL